jgi:hypothetical protein
MKHAKRIEMLMERAIHVPLFLTLTAIVYGFVLQWIWTSPVEGESGARGVAVHLAYSMMAFLATYATSWLVAWLWIFVFLVVPSHGYKTILYDPFRNMYEDIKPLHAHLLYTFLLELEMKARILARVSKEKNALQGEISAICAEKNIELDSSEIEGSMRAKLQSLEGDFQRERTEFFERVRYIWDEAIPGWGIELEIPARPSQWKEALRFKEWIALKHPTLLHGSFVGPTLEQPEAKS